MELNLPSEGMNCTCGETDVTNQKQKHLKLLSCKIVNYIQEWFFAEGSKTLVTVLSFWVTSIL